MSQIVSVFQATVGCDHQCVNLQEPLRKGDALGLGEREFMTVDEAHDAFERLTEPRATHDWRQAVRMTPVNGRDRGARDRGRAERERAAVAGL